MHRANFTGKALFSSYAVIHVQPLPSTLPDEFSMDMMNISGLFSRYKLCSSLYKTTALISTAHVRMRTRELIYVEVHIKYIMVTASDLIWHMA